MKRSLRWQFVFPLLVFFALTFAGLVLYLSNTYLKIYESHLRETLITESELLVQDLKSQPGFPENIESLQSETSRFAETLEVRVTIIRPDGVVLSDSEVQASTMENHLTRPEVQQALAGENGYQIRLSTTLQARLLYVAVPVDQNGEIVLIIRLAKSLDSIESELVVLNRSILISGAIVLVLLLGITYFFFDRSIKPIKSISEAAGEISKGNFTKIPIRRKGNEIDGLAQAFNDMSVQIKEQIDSLRTEKEKLSNILAQMQDGVVIVDSRGIVSAINHAAGQLFDVKEADVVGVQLLQAIQYFQVDELYEQTLKTGLQESVFIDLQQRKLYLQAIGSILTDPDGKSVLLLFQDISRQRQVEMMRKDFVSNVSHELRTPLASLRALSETLQTGALEDPPAAHHFVELMEIEISKLTQMVDELLALSRIESGRVVLKPEKIKVVELIKEAVSRMTLQAQRAGLMLTVDVTENLPEIMVDCEQIDQVLINLIHNAIKFTLPGGTVTVGVHQQNGQLIFFVRDNGVGIREEDLPRIFERFYKTDRSRAGKGTGLGLSIAKHVIEMHGGKIWAESEEGKGSTFYFSIPMVNR
jgi:two-component system phosphate regulon sensor histidine kinase PhoR